MLTIVDKVLFLQAVEIFNRATSDELALIGSIAKEVEQPKGATLFSEDETADAMYLVVKGRVSLQKDGQEIMVAREKEAFGTWALFDTEPRIMTANALEEVRLLKIEQDEFYDLLSDHVEITQSIFKALVQKVRRLVGG